MRTNQIHNVPYLKERRRALRSDLTSAEATLWKFIKGKQLGGRKFRRQHSIGNFIVDFYCAEEKLVIELDGTAHDNVGQANADYDRDAVLTALGFKVLRLDNEEVLKHIEQVLEVIGFCFREPDLP